MESLPSHFVSYDTEGVTPNEVTNTIGDKHCTCKYDTSWNKLNTAKIIYKPVSSERTELKFHSLLRSMLGWNVLYCLSWNLSPSFWYWDLKTRKLEFITYQAATSLASLSQWAKWEEWALTWRSPSQETRSLLWTINERFTLI